MNLSELRLVACTVLIILTVGVPKLHATICNSDDTNIEDIQCTSTNYEEYVACQRRITKRSAGCYDTANQCDDNTANNNNCVQKSSCNSCDCDSCSNSANNCPNSGCNSCCSTCCNEASACQSNHCCHRTCQATCKSSACRTSCRKTCNDYVQRNNDAVNATHPINNNVNVTVHQRHNITTIINLNNYINNTNNIQVPVVVNNTNNNNFTLQYPSLSDNPESENLIEDKNSTTTVDEQSCCHIVSPRQCVPQEKFPFMRCFHYRTKQCGPMCRAPIVHAQPHEVCDTRPNQTPNCHQQIIYIPQPQPRCAYQTNWPYVQCGQQQRSQCGGCYGHYANKNDFQRCSPYCYDDGFVGAGQYYRQGPIYRPGYSHTPSCYQLNYCNNDIDGGAAPYYPSGFGRNGGFGGLNGYYDGAINNNLQPNYGVGYPPESYDSYYFVETDPRNAIVNNWGNNKYGNRSEADVRRVDEPSPFLVNPAFYANSYPFYGDLDDVPNDVKIEASIQTARPQRDAEIEIKPPKQGDVEHEQRNPKNPKKYRVKLAGSVSRNNNVTATNNNFTTTRTLTA